MKISEIRYRIVSLMPRAAWVARNFGHSYKKGTMVGKNFIALAVRQLCGYKDDSKFADFLWESGIAKVLGLVNKQLF